MNQKTELLAPAGNLESFKAAVENGADAVYMGLGKYNARQMANNFTFDEYVDAIKYAHIRGTKVYLTLNTLMYNSEVKEALTLLLKLYSHGIDGVIVQDIGLAMLIRKIIPDLHIHASTQMSVHNLNQVKFFEKCGFSRVILSRELTLDEIEEICKNTSMEVEVFVHGALCVSYSGQCLMSSMIGGRSGNRGVCAQPCRMKYSLYDQNDKCIEKERYLLSKKDIFGLEYLSKLTKIGVKSFKIEGRNKSAVYVGLVTNKYRKYIDENIDNVDEQDKLELMQMFNRDGISSGYFDGVKYKSSITLNSPKNMGLLLGKIITQKKEYVKLKLMQDINLHDGIEIYSDGEVTSTIVTCIKDEQFNTMNKKVNKGTIVWIGDINNKVKFDSLIYKTSSYELNEAVKKTYTLNNFKKKISLHAKILIKSDMPIEIDIDKHNIKCSIDYNPEIAKTKPIDKKYLIDALSKTNDTPYVFEDIDIILDDNLYVPISKLNQLRRQAIEKLEDSYKIDIDINDKLNNLDKYLNIEDEYKLNCKENEIKEAVYVYKYNANKQYLSKNTKRIYINISDIIGKEKDIFEKYKDINVYICIPNIVNKNLNSYIINNIENLIKYGTSGFLVGNIGYINMLHELKQKYNIEIIADYSLNISNIYSAIFLKTIGFDVITMSLELPEELINEISDVIKVELVKDYVTVMSSRYCILGSFISDREKLQKCNMPCVNNGYYLKDSFDEKYYLVCDHVDCIMKIVKKISNQKYKDINNINNVESIRNCIL